MGKTPQELEDIMCNEARLLNQHLHEILNGKLNADEIYNIMTQNRNGLSLTESPASFTMKIVPVREPVVKLKQNPDNELEVLCPLPVAETNVLHPALLEDVHVTAMVNLNALPEGDAAFKDETMASRVNGKIYAGKDETENPPYEYKIILGDMIPARNFAIRPMQVGKWFPGKFTVYPD